jgi:4-hydroxybenzoate polyprenyltransferase
MRTWLTIQPGTLRTTGAVIAVFSIGVALLGSFLSSFFLMVALVAFLVGLVTFGIGYLADRRVDRHSPDSA